jgi:hypothetical protein
VLAGHGASKRRRISEEKVSLSAFCISLRCAAGKSNALRTSAGSDAVLSALDGRMTPDSPHTRKRLSHAKNHRNNAWIERIRARAPLHALTAPQPSRRSQTWLAKFRPARF